MSLDQINIPGNSGCRVELEHGPRLSVRKTALSQAYAIRLKRQCMKQQSFSPPISAIVIPRILDCTEVSFSMEHLPMLDAIEFLERATPPIIHARLQILVDLLSWELRESEPVGIPQSVFMEKINEIRQSVAASVWNLYFDPWAVELCRSLPEVVTLPVGPCHGDLTFSNIMFSLDENRIGLIDFLDSFVETPWIDLAKLRQDTRFHWTSYRYPALHDRGKVCLIDAWIDQILEREFGHVIASYEFWIMEVLNYLRIAPYFQRDTDYEYLCGALNRLFLEKESRICS